MENFIWALIVVSGTANVSFSTGYPSKALCEDAISIAKTGRTVIEEKSEQEKQKIASLRAKQEWLDANPGKNDHDYLNRYNSIIISTSSYIPEIRYAKCVLVDPKDK